MAPWDWRVGAWETNETLGGSLSDWTTRFDGFPAMARLSFADAGIAGKGMAIRKDRILSGS
jgi:hypothetical protein